ncbi:MAG: hypothetical protein P0S93_03725 [Candidatus Neptunochlamydia sp.]|nr:hypothetical protein [Candidatus Neptunochlamydia sp.]
MKKMLILAVAALSLFGLNLYADGQGEPVKDEPIGTTTDTTKEYPSSDNAVQVSLNDQEEETKGSFIAYKEGEEKPTEDERLA